METNSVRALEMTEDGRTLRLLDQRQLPRREVWLELDELEPIAQAIENLTVRGAPAIGCAAALGVTVVSWRFSEQVEEFREQLARALDRLANTRPTAVNLFVALNEIAAAVEHAPGDATVHDLRKILRETAQAHVTADLESCLSIGRHGAQLMPDTGAVLTHCNAGALATAGYGTALGVIRRAHELGKTFKVIADETRPVLQGARLTAWELAKDDIPVEVIADNMAGALMARGDILAAIVGADRIANNGDVANKIGTYTVAVLCRHHNIPLYVAAPWTTIDRSLASGREIPIEERSPAEIENHGSVPMTPVDVPVRNPAFDVTPAELVTAIITDRGVFKPAEIAQQPASDSSETP